MNSHIKGLLNHLATTGAYLRCVSWLNQYDRTTSILSFVHGVLYQLSPSCIRNALCQTMILKHVLDTQIFKNHKSKCTHQFMAFLMSKIPTSVCDALMNALRCLSVFCSFGCSLHQEGFDTEINPNFSTSCRWFNHAHFAFGGTLPICKNLTKYPIRPLSRQILVQPLNIY